MLVIGAGGLGLMCVTILKAMGGKGAVVVDIDEKRRAAALEAGARRGDRWRARPMRSRASRRRSAARAGRRSIWSAALRQRRSASTRSPRAASS